MCALYNFPRTDNETITEVIRDFQVTEPLIIRAEVVRAKIISHERSKRLTVLAELPTVHLRETILRVKHRWNYLNSEIYI